MREWIPKSPPQILAIVVAIINVILAFAGPNHPEITAALIGLQTALHTTDSVRQTRKRRGGGGGGIA